MSRPCELCGRSDTAKPVVIMDGDQRLYAWITAIISAAVLGLSVVGYKSCNADKAQPDQIRIEQIKAESAEKIATLQSQSVERQAKIAADAKAQADISKAYNERNLMLISPSIKLNLQKQKPRN